MEAADCPVCRCRKLTAVDIAFALCSAPDGRCLQINYEEQSCHACDFASRRACSPAMMVSTP
jgi:hypothetical protein